MRRKAKQARRNAQQQAQAALAVAAEHADAGRHAQLYTDAFTWVPPGAPIFPTPQPAVVAAEAPAPVDVNTEFLRVLEVVTRMCDHVIEYIEADRVERHAMVDALGRLVLTLGELAAAPPATAPRDMNGRDMNGRERIIGGSMPAGPDPMLVVHETDPLIDLRESDPLVDVHESVPLIDTHEPEIIIDLAEEEGATAPKTAVEVRCRFGEGERWVGGFEIVDVLSTDDAWKYRLRRQRDGAILPQLFDAASIRHIETFEELTTPEDRRWSRI